MSESARVLVVIGSGPGIGVGVASYFATKTFNRIALLSRNEERLSRDVRSILEAVEQSKGKEHGVVVKTYPIDASDVKQLETVLLQVVKDLGSPEVVVYNAARVGGGKFFEANEESVEYDFRVCIIRPLSLPGNSNRSRFRRWDYIQQLGC
jgi:NAD(P)-dependent dehydrogenase (short-subunit alcohol dehydrogenase family)